MLSPNNWSCLPTAFAICLNEPVKRIIDEIGHDGSEIWWPELPEPSCRRGFHIQEILNVLYHWGISVTPYEPVPMSRSLTGEPKCVNFRQSPEERMRYIMVYSHGVITGETKRGQRHAVAWDGKQILDPNGLKYGLDNFVVETFWLVR